MGIEAIRALPVAKWAAPDCLLFLWATNPRLRDGLSVTDSGASNTGRSEIRLGKNPSAQRKFCMGTGYYTRANAELCLLGRRGKPRVLSRAESMLIVSPRREHSRKPEETESEIERLVAGPYLELFARKTRSNWIARGDEVGKFARATGISNGLDLPGDIDAGADDDLGLLEEVRSYSLRSTEPLPNADLPTAHPIEPEFEREILNGPALSTCWGVSVRIRLYSGTHCQFWRVSPARPRPPPEHAPENIMPRWCGGQVCERGHAFSAVDRMSSLRRILVRAVRRIAFYLDGHHSGRGPPPPRHSSGRRSALPGLGRSTASGLPERLLPPE